MLSAPTSTAPAASIRSIKVASRGAGGRSRLILEPARVVRPCTSNKFFTAKGTPASGPTGLPAAISASIALALTRARSDVTSVKAFKSLSRVPIWASTASIASRAESFLFATACAMAVEVISAGSCGKDTGGLCFIWKLVVIDELRHFQRDLEIGADRRTPGVVDRDAQRTPDGVDVVVQWFSHLSPFNASATAGAESPSAARACRRPWDRRARLRRSLARRFAQSASR